MKLTPADLRARKGHPEGLPALTAYDFPMARLLDQAAKAKGYDVVIVWANADQEKQIKDVEDLIQRKVDIIVMGPVQQDGSMVAMSKGLHLYEYTFDLALKRLRR